jgi:hypothetical protein
LSTSPIRRRFELINDETIKGGIGIPVFENGLFTRNSRVYALLELFRRAGISQDFFQSWTIDFAYPLCSGVYEAVLNALAGVGTFDSQDQL